MVLCNGEPIGIVEGIKKLGRVIHNLDGICQVECFCHFKNIVNIEPSIIKIDPVYEECCTPQFDMSRETVLSRMKHVNDDDDAFNDIDIETVENPCQIGYWCPNNSGMYTLYYGELEFFSYCVEVDGEILTCKKCFVCNYTIENTTIVNEDLGFKKICKTVDNTECGLDLPDPPRVLFCPRLLTDSSTQTRRSLEFSNNHTLIKLISSIPNPFTDVIILNLFTSGITNPSLKIEVTNLLGYKFILPQFERKQSQEDLHSIEINTEQLVQGVYFIQIIVGDNEYVKTVKMIKQ